MSMVQLYCIGFFILAFAAALMIEKDLELMSPQL